MGVVRNVSSLSNNDPDTIESVLEEIQHIEQVQEQEIVIRRPRKIKHRSGNAQAVIGGLQNTSGKSGRRKNRYENSNYLLSLADPEEAKELTIHDFVPYNVSIFSKIFCYRENFEIWNKLVNCTDNENWIQKNISIEIHVDSNRDGRNEHLAYSPVDCFRKIDSDLRCMLKKKHVPLGPLMYLERELVTFFVNRPQSIFHCNIPSSFERLMIHALSQYMDLLSMSYDRSGSRWTRVQNKNEIFQLPSILLSSYLEKKHQRKS